MNRSHSFLSFLFTSFEYLCLPLSSPPRAPCLFPSAAPSPKIAVIGAGAAGLAVARVMQRAGLDQVLVLEKDKDIGGVWNYKQAAADRPMYRGLRTNLPKEVMRYREFPFPKRFTKSFLTHSQVLDYLKSYREHFNLPVQYGCTVNKLRVLEGQPSCVAHSSGDEPWPKIQLEWMDQQSEQSKKDIFDAVYIAKWPLQSSSDTSHPGH